MNTAINSAVSTATADMATKTEVASTYQTKLSETQLLAVNSGANSTNIANLNKYISGEAAVLHAYDAQNAQAGSNLANAIAGKQATLTAGTNITISGTTISATDTTYTEATTSTSGLMSAADKTKLDGLATVATSGSYNDLSDKPTMPTLSTLTIPEAITTDITVGHVASGTTIPAGTSMLDILKMVFTSVDNTPYTYVGQMSTIPTGSADIIAAAALNPIKMQKFATSSIKS